jgi:DNA (cytosine-5)-methyltransferase 1
MESLNCDTCSKKFKTIDSLDKHKQTHHIKLIIEEEPDVKNETIIDYDKLSKPELIKKCKELNIKSYSSKSKKEILEMINNATNTNKQSLEKEPIANYVLPLTNESNAKGLKYIDLFCGIGGFHQALNKLNAECVLACDIDKSCREVYYENYKLMPVEDVKKINEKQIPDCDIVCGGFPCQSFSNGGKKKMFDDERGLLFDEIMRIAKEKKPRFMFLENVKHILKVGNGEVIEYIKEKIKNLGYKLQIFEISPHNYGIPQQRERVYFVCVRNDIYNGVDIELPGFNGEIQMSNYLDEKDKIDKKYFINGDILKVLDAWDEMVQKFEVGEKISPTIMINDAYRSYTEEEFNEFPDWKQDYITKNKPLLEKYKSEFNEWYQKHSDVLQKREIYGKLEWQTGVIQNNDSIFNHFIQVRQSGIRVKKSKYFPTLVAISQIPIYGKEKRYITPRECARLQSFPDSFILAKDDKHSYKQLGNSVNVDNVYTVISSTLKHYGLLF